MAYSICKPIIASIGFANIFKKLSINAGDHNHPEKDFNCALVGLYTLTIPLAVTPPMTAGVGVSPLSPLGSVGGVSGYCGLGSVCGIGLGAVFGVVLLSL